MSESSSALPIVDNVAAPEIFASGRICYSMIGDDTVIVVFTSIRWCPEDNSGKNVVVGRMAMPLHKAQSLVLGLNTFLDGHGHAPASLATEGMMKQ